MEEVVLAHCVKVPILTLATPTSFTLQLDAGGAPGDGVVEITWFPGGTAPVVVPTATATAVPIPGALVVSAHYRRADDTKPPQVSLRHSR